MSSNAYYAEISPDPVLRRIVLASGVLLALAGIPLIITLPVALSVRVAAVGAWLALAIAETIRGRRGWNTCHALRFFPDGAVAVLLPGPRWQPARLVSGGILLRKTGWIRLEVTLPNGRKQVIGELLRGDSRKSDDWRRFHVIWRHIGAQIRSC